MPRLYVPSLQQILYARLQEKSATYLPCWFGDEVHYGGQDTPGMDLREKSGLEKDKKGIYYFWMKRTHSKRAVQHSRMLLQGWQANCDIKLLLYFSDPNLPDIGEIEDIFASMLWLTQARVTTKARVKKP